MLDAGLNVDGHFWVVCFECDEKWQNGSIFVLLESLIGSTVPDVLE